MSRARKLSNASAARPPTLTRRHRSKRNEELEKEQHIRQLNNAIVNRDISALIKLSLAKDGFVNDGLRRRVWPLLLHSDTAREVLTNVVPHQDKGQVELDIIRSMTHMSDDNVRRASKRQKQQDLQEVILDVLHRHPKLSYYQGFHDVCTCLLLVLGKDAAKAAAEKIALYYFRDAMHNTLEPVLDQLGLMFSLFRLEDPELQDFLDKSDTLPFFCLSWVITWCSHDISDMSKVARIYDFLLSFNPLMSVYLAAAVVMARRKELFTVECENAMVHTFLTKFPKDIDIELAISRAHELYMTYPPKVLQDKSGEFLDENSCVNTFNKPDVGLFTVDTLGVISFKTSSDQAVDGLLNLPRVKKSPKSALSKYSDNSLELYRRNMMTMLAFSAASVGTAAVLLLNSSAFREWVANSGLR